MDRLNIIPVQLFEITSLPFYDALSYIFFAIKVYNPDNV